MASPTPAPEKQRKWTDDYKRAIFAEFDALPDDHSGNRKQWFKDRKIAPAHFYRMRKEFQGSSPAPKKAIKGKHISPAGIEAIKEGQRKRWAAAKAAGTGKYSKVKGIDFKSADTQTKYQLIREYDALPEQEKAAWKKAHGINSHSDSSLLSYHRSRMPKEDASLRQAIAPYIGSVDSRAKVSPENLPALLAEYDAIQGLNGAKQKWLDERGLNYSSIHEMRKRLAYHQQQPAQQKPAQQKPFPAAQVLPIATPGPVITLDDAIAALQVRQDIWQEFMGLLKAMARGR